jgi:hypothetical protein
VSLVANTAKSQRSLLGSVWRIENITGVFFSLDRTNNNKPETITAPPPPDKQITNREEAEGARAAFTPVYTGSNRPSVPGPTRHNPQQPKPIHPPAPWLPPAALGACLPDPVQSHPDPTRPDRPSAKWATPHVRLAAGPHRRASSPPSLALPARSSSLPRPSTRILGAITAVRSALPLLVSTAPAL